MAPSELGAFLARSREEKGLSLEDIESRTHIRKKYLVALEAGDWDSLPPGVYTRGLLRSYAKALGISEASVSRYYAKERPQEAKLPEPQLISQPLVDEPRYSTELVLAAAGFAIAAVLLVWLVKTEFAPLLTAATQLLASEESAPPTSNTPGEVAGTPQGVLHTAPITTPTAGGGAMVESDKTVASVGGTSAGVSDPQGTATGEAGAPAGLAAPTDAQASDPGSAGATPAAQQTVQATVQAATGTARAQDSVPGASGTPRPQGTVATPRPGATAAAALRMSVRASGRVWLRVIADGAEIYTGFMQPGEQQAWGAREAVEIRTGNAGGTEVTLNGKRLAALGDEGVVLTCTWRMLPDGAIEQSC